MNLKVLLHVCDAYYCDYLTHTTFRFYLNDFQLKYPFSFLILRFLPQNHLALLKDRFLKKILLKRAKTLSLKTFLLKTPSFLSSNDHSCFELTLSPKDPYFLNSWFTCTSLYSNNVSRDISTPRLSLPVNVCLSHWRIA